MPEARDHFECRYYAVRLGGWRLGRRTFGGGTYTVGPISVNDCMALFQVIRDLGKTLADHDTELAALAKRAPAATLKPLLPLMVEERIKPRHLKRASALQVLTVLDAFYKANDFDYIVAAFVPQKGAKKGARISLPTLVHSIVTRCQVYTHHDVRRLPMQALLAMGDCEQELQRAAQPEKPVELTPEDHELLRAAGLPVN